MLDELMWRVTRRKSGLSSWLLSVADRYRTYYNDFDYDFDKNGEGRVMSTLARHDMKVVFDVGANVGSWARMAQRYLPSATVHCFELSPKTFVTLQSNLQGTPFHVNNFGLGDRAEEVTYKDYGPEHSTLNTVAPTAYHDRQLGFELRSSRLSTGDSYMDSARVPLVDLLKIDVEGAEHLVLKGFERALQAKAIRVIQFEYGYANGDAKFLMKDFYDLLEGFGYRIGKIWSDGVGFSKFDYQMNNFQSGPNYLAVLQTEHDLIRSLSHQR